MSSVAESPDVTLGEIYAEIDKELVIARKNRDGVHNDMVEDESKRLTPNERINIHIPVELLLQKYNLQRTKAKEIGAAPSSPILQEVGQALAIGDSFGAMQRLGVLFQDPPESIRKYWWKILGKPGAVKPDIAERVKASAIGPDTPLDPKKLHPMPDLGNGGHVVENGDCFGQGRMLAPLEIMKIFDAFKPDIEEAIEKLGAPPPDEDDEEGQANVPHGARHKPRASTLLNMTSGPTQEPTKVGATM